METQELVVHRDDSMLVFGSQKNFENAQRMAKVLNSSSIVPAQYQGEKNLANCIIALEMANRIGMSPLAVMQNLYVVHGNPGWSSKFLVAAINACGKFSPLRYEFKGTEGKDDWGCRAWATDSSGEKLFGAWVTIEMAKKEGWHGKNGSKWQTMPEQMLRYRAAAFFQRVYAPEIGMGMQTAEELHDVGPKVIDADYEDVTEKVSAEIKQNANKGKLRIDESPSAHTGNTAAEEIPKPEEVKEVEPQTEPDWAKQ